MRQEPSYIAIETKGSQDALTGVDTWTFETFDTWRLVVLNIEIHIVMISLDD